MTCCVTGHRPAGFPFPRVNIHPLYMEYLVQLSNEIEVMIKQGYDTFLTGMADGADIDFAKTVIAYKKIYSHLSLEAAIPYPISPTKKITSYHMNRNSVLEVCDITHIVSDHYFRGCMDKRNRFMVDRADVVFAIWNGEEHGGTWNTIKYARSKEKPIRFLMLAEEKIYVK